MKGGGKKMVGEGVGEEEKGTKHLNHVSETFNEGKEGLAQGGGEDPTVS